MGLRKLTSNIGATMVTQVATAILTLFLTILVAHALGRVGNGIYVLALLLPGTLSMLWNLGITPANAYFVGAKRVSVPVALWTTIEVSAILSLLGSILTAPVIVWYSAKLFPAVPQAYLWWMLPVFPISMMQMTLASLFLGMQNFKPFNLAAVVTSAANFLGAVLFILVIKLSVVGALAAFALGQLAGLVLTCVYLYPLLGTERPRTAIRAYASQSISYGYKAHLSNVIGFVNYRVDVFLVGLMLGAAPVGVYAIAVQIAERFWMLSYAVSGVILPRLSELHADEDTRRRLTPLISRWVLYLTAMMALIVIVFGKPLILLFFGREFRQAYSIILWLLPGIVICGFARILAGDIAARGRTEINLFVTTFVVVFNIVANLLLIPSMGVYGGALSTSIAYTLDAIIRIVIYARLSGNAWHLPILPIRQDLELLLRAWKFITRRMRRAT